MCIRLKLVGREPLLLLRIEYVNKIALYVIVRFEIIFCYGFTRLKCFGAFEEPGPRSLV